MSDSQIDETILSNVEEHWRKVASVIGRTAEALSIDESSVAKRIEALVHDGRLEAKGYVQYWRFSEIRLPNTTGEAEESTPSDFDSAVLRLTKADMVRKRFPGMDSLIAYIPQGQQPSASLEKQLWSCDHQARWLPKDGGHVVKMAYRGEDVLDAKFKIEPGGWNEDCDGCDGQILAGQECWVTTGEIIHVLCDSCYQTLKGA
jgi:hypothetical protein